MEQKQISLINWAGIPLLPGIGLTWAYMKQVKNLPIFCNVEVYLVEVG
jgi:hypothetical protein